MRMPFFELSVLNTTVKSIYIDYNASDDEIYDKLYELKTAYYKEMERLREQ